MVELALLTIEGSEDLGGIGELYTTIVRSAQPARPIFLAITIWAKDFRVAVQMLTKVGVGEHATVGVVMNWAGAAQDNFSRGAEHGLTK